MEWRTWSEGWDLACASEETLPSLLLSSLIQCPHLWAQVFSSTTGCIESFYLPGILARIRWDIGFGISGELFKCEIIVNNAGESGREALPFEGPLTLPPTPPSWSSAVRVSLFQVWGGLWLQLDQAVLSASLKMAVVSSAQGPMSWHSVADNVPHVLPAPLFGNTGLGLSPHCLLVVGGRGAGSRQSEIHSRSLCIREHPPTASHEWLTSWVFLLTSAHSLWSCWWWLRPGS